MVIRIGSHASEVKNAWRNIARVSNPRNTFASIIVAAFQNTVRPEKQGSQNVEPVFPSHLTKTHGEGCWGGDFITRSRRGCHRGQLRFQMGAVAAFRRNVTEIQHAGPGQDCRFSTCLKPVFGMPGTATIDVHACRKEVLPHGLREGRKIAIT